MSKKHKKKNKHQEPQNQSKGPEITAKDSFEKVISERSVPTAVQDDEPVGLNITTKIINDEEVNEVVFEPNGMDHGLQLAISTLMHNRAMDSGIVSLASLGYFHVNTLTYQRETDTILLKVYFHAALAMRKIKSETNGSYSYVPRDELRIFQNYLYTGDINDCYYLAKARMPKFHSPMRADENGQPYLEVIDDSKMEEAPVMVIQCNLPVTIAAALDVSLLDPAFDIHCETIGRSHLNEAGAIVSGLASAEVPLRTVVTFSPNTDGYDPNEINAYMILLNEKIRTGRRNQEELKEKVKNRSDKAKKKEKKARRALDEGFKKYS